MDKQKISYQSFCWVIGTTSFRTAKLNLKIEEQLILLDRFYQKVTEKDTWLWNNDLQSKYYDFMKQEGFLFGEASRKDKDAREKTSGLVNLGLVSNDRIITEAGRLLLQITKKNDFTSNNIFNISNDSYVYLKQLLKTTIKVNDSSIRPYIVLAKCLTELDYLTYEELTYFVPLIISRDSAEKVIDDIRMYRKKQLSIENIIYDRLITMKNYQTAKTMLLNNAVSEDLICTIGINRKSKSYDKPYYALYLSLKSVFIDKNDDVLTLWENIKKVKHKAGTLWKNLLFKKTTITKLKKDKLNCVQEFCPFLNCHSEIELKETFFKYLHVFKAMATLTDYFDLNRRYFNITDTLIFDDERVKFDIFPKYYFAEIIDKLYEEAFSSCDVLSENLELEKMAKAFNFDVKLVYQKLSDDFGSKISNPNQVKSFIDDERYTRFNKLIEEKFTNRVLLELLDCFEQRNDKRIEELVTDEASIPTIFEYILGIIWYKISECKGNILDFMKLSLEANLLPKTHAGGGTADIVYEYDQCKYYPKHTLLLEVTLADKTNQGRMEIEPVSRHLRDRLIKFGNRNDYTLFIGTSLDQNVIFEFRYKKLTPYTIKGKRKDGMKIIPIDTQTIKKFIQNQIQYRYLYKVFDKYYEEKLGGDNDLVWQINMVKEATTPYKV